MRASASSSRRAWRSRDPSARRNVASIQLGSSALDVTRRAKAWEASSLTSDDIEVDTESEIGDSAAARRNTILELYSAGLLSDADGKIDRNMRYKILRAFGFGSLEQADSTAELQRNRAKKENADAAICKPEVHSYDDHAAHIDVHTACLLSSGTPDNVAKALEEHIECHKRLLMEEK